MSVATANMTNVIPRLAIRIEESNFRRAPSERREVRTRRKILAIIGKTTMSDR
jgi:hypothetical protein